MITRRSKGFTLIELLLVIAIIGLLVALSVPAIQASREAARRTQCINHQKQLGIAFTSHESARKSFPASFTLWAKGPLASIDVRVHSFMSELLPYLEGGGTEAQYHRDANFFAAVNREAIKSPIPVAMCPSAPRTEAVAVTKFMPSLLMTPSVQKHAGLTQTVLDAFDAKFSAEYEGGVSDYSIPVHADKNLARSLGYEVPSDSIRELASMFPLPDTKVLLQRLLPLLVTSATAEIGERMRAGQITDGLSRTFMVTEVAGRPDYWERGMQSSARGPLVSAWADPLIVFKIKMAKRDEEDCLINCDNDAKIYSFHPGGANFLFADGHVEFLDEKIEPRVLLALMTPDQDDTGKVP